MSAERPELLTEPWRVRHQKLCKFFGRALNQYDELTKAAVDDEIASLVLPGSSTTLKLRSVVAGKTLQYGVKRILRLRQPWSGALLSEFAQYQARAAFEHPFGHRAEAPTGANGDQGPD